MLAQYAYPTETTDKEEPWPTFLQNFALLFLSQESMPQKRNVLTPNGFGHRWRNSLPVTSNCQSSRVSGAKNMVAGPSQRTMACFQVAMWKSYLIRNGRQRLPSV